MLKRIFSAGIAVDYPVCGAQVQVWEVEPIFLIIDKLSNVHLQKIREYLLNPQPLPPGPNPPDPGPLALASLGQMEIARPLAFSQTFNADSEEHRSLRTVALTGSLPALRQALVATNETFLRFLLCWLFPLLVTKRLVGTVTTDRCGNFEDFIILGCYDNGQSLFHGIDEFSVVHDPNLRADSRELLHVLDLSVRYKRHAVY